ncbi:riboflavin transporter MCH5 [Biscogniauxia mediterranea]|nr:riboflavin transporter MCH5 [Biscogniauxia mediterranea]
MKPLQSMASTPVQEGPDRLAAPDATEEQTVRDTGEPLPQLSRTTSDQEMSPRAWLSVAGAFLFLFPSYGFIQSIGNIQSYLELNQLSAYTSRDVGWIVGVFTFLALLFGIQIGPLFDVYGPRILGPVGCAIYIPVFFVLAECKSYWQFMLVLGVWGGIGAAILSTVGVAIVGKFFVRRRGLAMGVALSGSTIGAIVMSLLLRELFPKMGWTGSIRILAILISVVTIGGTFCLPQPPLESHPGRHHRPTMAVLNFRALKSGTFIFVTIGLSALEFAIFGVYSLLPTYASRAGLGSDAGFTLLAIVNATGTAGRCLPGLAGDFFGHFNVLLCMILCTIIITAVILVPFETSLATLYTFSALWGFGSGSFISLTPVCMGKTCETKEYGRYFGTMYFFVSFALLLASPLGGQMLQTFGTKALACLYVAVVALGGICFFLARQLLLGMGIWRFRVLI